MKTISFKVFEVGDHVWVKTARSWQDGCITRHDNSPRAGTIERRALMPMVMDIDRIEPMIAYDVRLTDARGVLRKLIADDLGLREIKDAPAEDPK